MKRILLTATVYSHIAQFHKPLIKLLKEHNCIVHVAGKNNLSEKDGLSIRNVDCFYDLPFSRSPFAIENILVYMRLKKIIKENKYDVIHCNTPMGGIITRLASKSQRKFGTKVVYTAHGFHFYKGAPKKNWLFYYPIEKIFSKITDLIITITKEDYKLAKNKFFCKVVYTHGVGANKERFTCKNTDKKDIRKKYGFSDNDFILLTIGELNSNKNQIVVLETLSKLKDKIPNIKYLLAGNGPKLTELKNFVSEKKLDDIVVFLGYTTQVNNYLHLSDVLVSASKREGLPLNIMEAMLSKTCVIASKNRGHNELIVDQKSGLLFNNGDIDQLSNCIFSVYSDSKLRDSLISNAYERVDSFTSESVIRELESIYESLLINNNE